MMTDYNCFFAVQRWEDCSLLVRYYTSTAAMMTVYKHTSGGGSKVKKNKLRDKSLRSLVTRSKYTTK